MPFEEIDGLAGKVYVPRTDPTRSKKHPCRDCFDCQHCSEDRCRLCRGTGPTTPCAERGSDRPASAEKAVNCRKRPLEPDP